MKSTIYYMSDIVTSQRRCRLAVFINCKLNNLFSYYKMFLDNKYNKKVKKVYFGLSLCPLHCCLSFKVYNPPPSDTLSFFDAAMPNVSL